MKAVRVHEYGGPEVLRQDEVERPEPKEGEALVRVAYASLNFHDIYNRIGRYPLPGFPMTIGVEGAGTVEAVGPGVAEVHPGQRVCWCYNMGSYAEYLATPAWRLVPLPDDVDFRTAAALAVVGMTSHYLLTSIHETKPGDWVLIHAAVGGVGIAAVQVAKLRGALVIATVGSDAKAEIAREYGADHVVNYSNEDFVQVCREVTGGEGVHAVLDGVGKATFAGSMEAVRVRGQVIIFGSASGPADPIMPNSLQPRSLKLAGSGLFNYTRTRDELLWRANDVFDWYRAGKLRPRIFEALTLGQAGEAHRMLESRGTVGKLLLEVGG